MRPLSMAMACAWSRGSSTTSQSPTSRKQTITNNDRQEDQQTARAACRAARPGILGQEVLAKSHRPWRHRSLHRGSGQSAECRLNWRADNSGGRMRAVVTGGAGFLGRICATGSSRKVGSAGAGQFCHRRGTQRAAPERKSRIQAGIRCERKRVAASGRRGALRAAFRFAGQPSRLFEASDRDI